MLTKASTASPSKGLAFSRVFSRKGLHPFEELSWEKRTCEITDDGGKVVFRQENVEVPRSWSPLAAKIAVSKYFHGDSAKGTDPHQGGREQSVKQLIHRVTRTLADWALEDGYVATPEAADLFYEELAWLCVNQYGAFNSPVWFNVGLHRHYGTGTTAGRGNFYYNAAAGRAERAATPYAYPQCSACFIQGVEDNLESIMELARSEAMLFKYGSGTGSDLSPLRSTREKLSGGGRPSGPLSFLKVYDQIANVVKSGGKTRRAAKMNTLKDWHPDIEEFIECKAKEEKKAWALIEQGYDGTFNGEAYGSVLFQNENLSVRASDAFLQAAVDGEPWQTRAAGTGNILEEKSARALLRKIAEGAWICGDPGLQFDDTIHTWHTCKASGRQHSSNPCSEYLFLNDTACNLASLNLMKFKGSGGSFDTRRFAAAVRLFITAQEILVDRSSYPTEAIAANSHRFRTLGLGYANLGSLIMDGGHGYDSDEGRGLCGAITALMTGEAYAMSAEIAALKGPFEGLDHPHAPGMEKTPGASNRPSMLEVIRRHRGQLAKIDPSAPTAIREAAEDAWTRALEMGEIHGYRNAQVTVLAPTGTIGFLMDCDTTGIEPDIALVKYKLLAGGGTLKIVNQTVPHALRALGYPQAEIEAITAHIDTRDTIEGAPGLKPGHLPVFDCAFKPAHGTRSLHYLGHLKMMAAAQPFLSGGISKTVNLPQDATVDDILNTYLEGWRLGLKAIAIYREGSKRSAPLSTQRTDGKNGAAPPKPLRRRMPDTRMSITHKFDIAGHEGYITVGLFEDKTPGEVFISMAKEGSTIGGLMDSIGTLTSLALQYGVPLETLVRKFAHARFEPSGFTRNPDIRNAKSIIDYIYRWLGCQFIAGYREATSPDAGQQEFPLKEIVEMEKRSLNRPVEELALDVDAGEDKGSGLALRFRDGMTCPECGSSKILHTGSCATCLNCGASLGCS